MNTFEVTDFDKVCRICMKFDKTLLSIISFKIIDMIKACSSVQIWENDDLPNQICHTCFLQLQNTINFKQSCETSDNAFRQIIGQNKINDLTNNENFIDIKEEKIEDYDDDNSVIDIKEEDISENPSNKISVELNGIQIPTKCEEENNSSKNIKDDEISVELNGIQIPTKCEEENNSSKNIKDDENAMEKEFNCEMCCQVFEKIWRLGRHMNLAHNAKALQCNKCEVICYHPLHLEEHQELTHNLTCNKCNKKFSNNYNLKSHKPVCKQSLFKFHLCEATFKDKRERKSHTNKHNTKKVACHTCGKTVFNLKRHLLTHEEREKITCDKCSKSFVNESTFRVHIKEIHGERIRKHLCNVCGHASGSAADLRKHLATHSTERPYACKHCDKTYRSEDNLRVHISSSHLDKRKFQCKFCPQAFNLKKTLVHHERCHTGEKPHKCKVCGKRFIQKIGLQTHSKTHTNI